MASTLSAPSQPSAPNSTTPSRSNTPLPDPSTTNTLPRILCLHGGGTNASIFRSQLRSFLTNPRLATRFRFVFVEAPFPCDEGIGVKPVYADWGPFRRWSRWLKSHETIDAAACMGQILDAVEGAMAADNEAGGTAPFVGVLGFSQGAKVACSLLLKQQLDEAGGKLDPRGERLLQRGSLRFGVVMAGRAPLLALTSEMEAQTFLQSAAGLADEADMDDIYEAPEWKLRLPTLHVHGLRDEGLELHRRCVDDYCAAGTTTVVEWDGPHRVPIKRVDVEKVVDAIVDMADEYGV